MQYGRFIRATVRQINLTNKKSFTLSELIIATAIFAFAITGILQMFISCAFLDQANRNNNIAIVHAETALEYIKSLSFNTIQNNICLNGAPVTWDLQPTLNLRDLTNEGINVTTTASCCSRNPLVWLDITVNLSWLDNLQRERSLVLGTSISK